MSVIDTTTDQVVSSIDVGPSPHGLAISADGRKVLVIAFGADQAIVLDATTDRILAQMPVPLAHNGAISPDGKHLYFTLAGADAVLDTATNQIVGQIATGASPHVALFAPNGLVTLVVKQGPGEPGMIEPTNNTISATVKVGTAHPERCASSVSSTRPWA